MVGRFKDRYVGEWPRWIQNIEKLEASIQALSPDLTVHRGVGAESSARNLRQPASVIEPNLSVYYNEAVLCHIDVSGSGSASVRVPPNDIWVRPDKLDLAQEKESNGEYFFFWMVYEASTHLVVAVDAFPYREEVHERFLRGNTEHFCFIPASVGKPPSTLYDWINERLDA